LRAKQILLGSANVTAALTSIDGSAATGNLTIAAGTRTAFTDTTTGTFYFQYGSLTIKGGSGDDNITHAASSGGTVYSNDGNDIVTLEGTSQIAYLGFGGDTVNLSGGGQTVDLGADTDGDEVVFSAVSTTAGSVTTVAAPAGYAIGAFTSSTRFVTVNNFKDGDRIDLSVLNNGSSIADATSTADDYMSLVDAVNGVLGLLGSTGGPTDLAYFEWLDGNTYVVAEGDEDVDTGTTGNQYFNAVIKITGVVDLIVDPAITTGCVLTFA
jgi:hypothetical protein